MSACEAETHIGGDRIRCAQDARPGGLCYYHGKMRRGLLEPAMRVSEVRTVGGVRIHPPASAR